MTTPLVSPVHKAGTIAIVGRPNVGKSTLLNALIGSKLSITSRKAQTTRHRIVGVLTRDHAQLCFLDTPGYQTKHINALNTVLNKTVSSTTADADVVVMVIDCLKWTTADQTVLTRIPSDKPLIIVTNKVDTLANKNDLLPMLAKLGQLAPQATIVPVSAAKGVQVADLEKVITDLLPAGDRLYDEDMLTDRSLRFLAAELIREKVFRQLGEEVPYDCTVVIDKFEEDEQRHIIHASILVQRDAQKPIILGKDGERIKKIGSDARRDMQTLFDTKVHLELWVRVKSGWADSAQSLRSYGYE